MDTINSLEEIDWSFPNLNNTGIHSFHWYPATFLAAIPGTLIPYFAEKGGVVLDPFCGSGTTGVEAIRLGRDFIGIDTNPIALLMAEAKLYFPATEKFKKVIYEVVERSESLFENHVLKVHPQANELLAWYHPDTMYALDRILNSILIVKNANFKRCLLSVFSGILKTCSSQGKHWGWVCDNVKPKSGEIIYKDALHIFLNASLEFLKASEKSYDAIKVYSENKNRNIIRSKSSLYYGDCVSRMTKLPGSSIDFIMTSPPYYGVADYIKSQRLSYLWFDKDELASYRLGFRDFENLRIKETGARSNRSRKNSHSSYINFMQQFFNESFRLLKDNCHIALVVGESQSREATTDLIIETAQEKGFVLSMRESRIIKNNRRRLMAKVKDESILVFTKNNIL